MVFLNSVAMIALTALAVPIIIHLRRQRKANVISWAAMQFLSHSLVKRNRGLALEHLLLLLCRCLLIVMFVLAMARPQMISTADLRWIPGLVLGMVGLITLVCAVVIKAELWKRMTTAAAGLLLITSMTALAAFGSPKLPPWGEPCDVAIVIDASSSMNVEVDGKSNFRRARDEASLLVDSLPGGSTVSILAAGPVVTLPSPPKTNLRRVTDELAGMEATGGGSDLYQAISLSRIALEESPNTRKQIVVFSDNQLSPWQQIASQAFGESSGSDSESDAQAGDQADEGISQESGVDLFCRALPLPQELQDVSVTGLELDAGTVSIHRPLRIDVDLLNGGSENVSNLELELLINNQVAQSEPVRQLEKKSHTSLRFTCQFDQPGWSTVSARIKGADRLQENNTLHHVVQVAEELSVLIVNGNPSNQPFRRAATLIQLALDPASLKEQSDPEGKRSQLTKVSAIDAADIGQVASFSDYDVIVLCDVPRLPRDVADQLAKSVEQGGGLWVLPGERCQQGFYNAWALESSGKPLLPMQMTTRFVVDPQREKPLELDFDSVAHVTLDPLFETGQHDLSELQVSAHWKLRDWPSAKPAQVAARLTNGDPLLVEHAAGRGRVLVTAISFDSLESNLISRVAFPVLTHLWVEHLSSNHAVDRNYQPQRNLLVQLDASDLPPQQNLALETPNGMKRSVQATVSGDDDQAVVEAGLADAPGLYQLTAATPAEGTTIPFTVLSDHDEFDLTAASEVKLAELGRDMQVKWITDIDQIEKIARGSLGEVDLWKYFATSAMVMLVLEVIVMRWIAWRRRTENISGAGQIVAVRPPQKASVLQGHVGAFSHVGRSHSSTGSSSTFSEAVK